MSGNLVDETLFEGLFTSDAIQEFMLGCSNKDFDIMAFRKQIKARINTDKQKNMFSRAIEAYIIRGSNIDKIIAKAIQVNPFYATTMTNIKNHFNVVKNVKEGEKSKNKNSNHITVTLARMCEMAPQHAFEICAMYKGNRAVPLDDLKSAMEQLGITGANPPRECRCLCFLALIDFTETSDAIQAYYYYVLCYSILENQILKGIRDPVINKDTASEIKQRVFLHANSPILNHDERATFTKKICLLPSLLNASSIIQSMKAALGSIGGLSYQDVAKDVTKLSD